MTRRQRDALKLAMLIMGERERALANQSSRKSQEQYKLVVEALQTIEEMLRGVQGVIEI